MKIYCMLAIAIFGLYSCSNNNTQTDAAPGTVAVDSLSFFPVTSFIRGQILTLDSLPVTPLKLTIAKGKTDSVWVQKKDLRALLEPFLSPVIGEKNLIPYFKETRFTDQTINMVTFTYDTKSILPDSLTIQHWDVYVSPETGKVAKVYIVKKLAQNNQSFTQQLTWQTDQQAKIVTILNKPDGSMELVNEVLLTWVFSTGT